MPKFLTQVDSHEQIVSKKAAARRKDYRERARKNLASMLEGEDYELIIDALGLNDPDVYDLIGFDK